MTSVPIGSWDVIKSKQKRDTTLASEALRPLCGEGITRLKGAKQKEILCSSNCTQADRTGVGQGNMVEMVR